MLPLSTNQSIEVSLSSLSSSWTFPFLTSYLQAQIIHFLFHFRHMPTFLSTTSLFLYLSSLCAICLSRSLVYFYFPPPHIRGWTALSWWAKLLRNFQRQPAQTPTGVLRIPWTKTLLEAEICTSDVLYITKNIMVLHLERNRSKHFPFSNNI